MRVGRGLRTYQEYAGDVEHERHERVEKQHRHPRAIQVLHLERRELGKQRHEEVHGRAHGRVVVQANQRVHFHVVPAQQHLYHDQPHGLEHHSPRLEHEAHPREAYLPGARDRNPHRDAQDVQDVLGGRAGDAPDVRDDEDGDGPAGLEHLDEGDVEVEVDEVAADERGRVEDADGDDGAEVGARGHLYAVAAVEEGGGAGEELGREGREGEVPAGEDDGWRGVSGVGRAEGRGGSWGVSYDILGLLARGSRSKGFKG